ncbi:hypothetical protein ON010_g12741 [Phytophthora cinnamomi]|nr:hypothetical protein ON010_g12741 [Phytophthora cinnamomi]
MSIRALGLRRPCCRIWPQTKRDEGQPVSEVSQVVRSGHFTRDGIAHDRERIATIRATTYPSTAGQLQRFLSAPNWIRESIADYARAVDPL